MVNGLAVVAVETVVSKFALLCLACETVKILRLSFKAAQSTESWGSEPQIEVVSLWRENLTCRHTLRSWHADPLGHAHEAVLEPWEAILSISPVASNLNRRSIMMKSVLVFLPSYNFTHTTMRHADLSCNGDFARASSIELDDSPAIACQQRTTRNIGTAKAITSRFSN